MINTRLWEGTGQDDTKETDVTVAQLNSALATGDVYLDMWTLEPSGKKKGWS